MRLWIVLLVSLLLGASAACSRDAATEVLLPGIRLGMTPRDVRDRFEGGGDGSWQTRVGAGDDTVLEWNAAGDKGRATNARFEFHLGMLVAVRAHLREAVAAERVALTPGSVTLQAPGQAGAGGSELTILARDCPTHREEAASLASRAAK